MWADQDEEWSHYTAITVTLIPKVGSGHVLSLLSSVVGSGFESQQCSPLGSLRPPRICKVDPKDYRTWSGGSRAILCGITRPAEAVFLSPWPPAVTHGSTHLTSTDSSGYKRSWG